MKRTLIAPIVVMAAVATAAAPAAHAQGNGNGAGKDPCWMVLFNTIGGEVVHAPGGNELANCRYAGPAEGGGVDPVLPGNSCFITPAGNFQCAGDASPGHKP